MKKTIEIILLSIFFSTVSLSSFGSNYNFLSNTAMSYFTKEDWNLSRMALHDALNHYKDGAKVAWKNPRSGSYGAFLPSRTIYAKGAVCRHLKIMNVANLMHEDATYTFCKLHNEWKIM
ncbi:MAG: hypothetical protein KIT56_00155 [Gammaproteobacteria bacterium]|nr:hypothetical protein [Gammaproteobacteria bacterium]MCW5582297.1 hypothetical protein [Gammaproteobacteria bacterium]